MTAQLCPVSTVPARWSHGGPQLYQQTLPSHPNGPLHTHSCSQPQASECFVSSSLILLKIQLQKLLLPLTHFWFSSSPFLFLFPVIPGIFNFISIRTANNSELLRAQLLYFHFIPSHTSFLQNLGCGRVFCVK